MSLQDFLQKLRRDEIDIEREKDTGREISSEALDPETDE
jgi:hypothetical protein